MAWQIECEPPARFFPTLHTGVEDTWLADLRCRLRLRLVNPALRTLAIQDIVLLPAGLSFWAAGTERRALVLLAPGLCGYDTLTRLPRAARRELEEALKALCAVQHVDLLAAPGGWSWLADGLVVAGQLGGALGIVLALSASPLLAGGAALLGALVAGTGQRVAATG